MAVKIESTTTANSHSTKVKQTKKTHQQRRRVGSLKLVLELRLGQLLHELLEMVLVDVAAAVDGVVGIVRIVLLLVGVGPLALQHQISVTDT